MELPHKVVINGEMVLTIFDELKKAEGICAMVADYCDSMRTLKMANGEEFKMAEDMLRLWRQFKQPPKVKVEEKMPELTAEEIKAAEEECEREAQELNELLEIEAQEREEQCRREVQELKEMYGIW